MDFSHKEQVNATKETRKLINRKQIDIAMGKKKKTIVHKSQQQKTN